MPHNLHHFFHAREGEEGVGGEGRIRGREGISFPYICMWGRRRRRRVSGARGEERKRERGGGKREGGRERARV